MKVIGITGGIGSGKSFVASLAAQFFPILHISTDDIAKEQMKKGGCSYKAVVEAFADECEILDGEGELNRAELAKLVFADEKKLALLNSITHPNVLEEMNRIIELAREEGEYEAVLIESALIFESGICERCDAVWYVYSPVETRVERLMSSRGYSEQKIKSILDDQLSEEEFVRRSDAVIYNDNDTTIEMLVMRISELAL